MTSTKQYKPQTYIRHGIINNIHHVLDQIDFSQNKLEYVFLDKAIKMWSPRYKVFHNSQTCSKCGLIGTFFAIERTHNPTSPPNPRFHLNLYGINKNGQEILFTKDHIIAKANGGKNFLSNYQTMCAPCNFEKGHK